MGFNLVLHLVSYFLIVVVLLFEYKYRKLNTPDFLYIMEVRGVYQYNPNAKITTVPLYFSSSKSDTSHYHIHVLSA